ncbi:hypothetical protein AAMO2058_001007000 [Amorphochlora amoebiformis]
MLRCNYKAHERTHTGEKPFHCTLCPMKFAQQSTLQRHERLHKGIRPYMCNICNDTFVQPASLDAHMRVHKNERPYYCRLCFKRFNQRANLRVHYYGHHIQYRPFQCKLCKFRATEIGPLVDHLALHKRSIGYKNQNEMVRLGIRQTVVENFHNLSYKINHYQSKREEDMRVVNWLIENSNLGQNNVSEYIWNRVPFASYKATIRTWSNVAVNFTCINAESSLYDQREIPIVKRRNRRRSLLPNGTGVACAAVALDPMFELQSSQ